MSIETPNQTSSQPILGWTVHLARQCPAKTAFCALFVAAASVLAFLSVGPAAALIVPLALVAFLSDFLFPVRYEITSESAVSRLLLNRTEIRWANVKRSYVDDHGVKLSPLDGTSRLEAFRGVYLRFNGNESQVIETVKSLRPADV